MSEEQRLRDIFSNLEDVPEDGALCPPAERILDSADGRLSAEENREIIGHIGECAACSTAWWLARETSEPAKVKKKELAFQRWPILVAAALVILAVGIYGLQQLRTDPSSEPVYRAQEGSWLTSDLPVGESLLRESCVLRWTAGPEETLYDLVVTDEDLKTLVSVSRLSASEYSVDPAALAGLSPGDKILWRVTATLPNGSRMTTPTFTSVVE